MRIKVLGDIGNTRLIPYIGSVMSAPPRISRSLLASYGKLTQKKFRSAEGKFIVEGLRSVEEALISSWPLEALLVTPAFAARPEFIREVAPRAEKAGIPLYATSEREIARLADTVTPQGIAAVALERTPAGDPFATLGEHALTVALEGISDPGNLGTIIRTCDWFG